MPTFPSIKPTSNVAPSIEYRILEAKFGDGYEQRLADGINTRKQTVSLEFRVSDADADTIIAFLDARAGVESFDYTLPKEGSARTWVCKRWSGPVALSASGAGSMVTAEFEEVFN